MPLTLGLHVNVLFYPNRLHSRIDTLLELYRFEMVLKCKKKA